MILECNAFYGRATETLYVGMITSTENVLPNGKIVSGLDGCGEDDESSGKVGNILL